MYNLIQNKHYRTQFNLYKRENGWLIDYDGKLLDMYNCSMSFY